MSSCLRSSVVSRSLPAAPGFVVAYFENVHGVRQPFPWRFNKRTQQIDLDFVDGFNVNTSLSDTPLFFRGQQFGALHLVQGLGPKFIQWFENRDDVNAGSVTLVEKPVVVYANSLNNRETPDSGESAEREFSFSFERGDGSVEGQYSKTLIFMKPMVISYTKTIDDVVVRYYRWFSNNYEGNT